MKEVSQTEFEVLDVLWQQYPASANDIIERLNQQKEWHEKTVKTLLNRLVKKHAISFEKQQRRYLYTPLIARDEYVESQSQSLVERLFKGKLSPLVAGFAKNKDLDKDDIAELKNIIASWEQENEAENKGN